MSTNPGAARPIQARSLPTSGAARPARVLAAALAMSLPLLAQAADLTVHTQVDLKAKPAEVWAAVGDFASLAWHPVVAGTTLDKGSAKQPGAQRTVTTKDGAKLVEQLVGRNDKSHQLSYRILQSPLPVKGYVSRISVQAHGSGSRVVWDSHFKRDPKAEGVTDDKAREIVGGIYTAGFDGLKQQFGTP